MLASQKLDQNGGSIIMYRYSRSSYLEPPAVSIIPHYFKLRNAFPLIDFLNNLLLAFLQFQYIEQFWVSLACLSLSWRSIPYFFTNGKVSSMLVAGAHYSVTFHL